MKTETREVYFCGHCNKLYLRKKWALKHEKVCTYNPDNDRKCFRCDHCEKLKNQMYFGNEELGSVDICHCNKLDVYIYPPKVEHKGNAFLSEDLGKDNIPMKKECEHFQMYGLRDAKDVDDFFNFLKG